jgi:hypothetical protein
MAYFRTLTSNCADWIDFGAGVKVCGCQPFMVLISTMDANEHPSGPHHRGLQLAGMQ